MTGQENHDEAARSLTTRARELLAIAHSGAPDLPWVAAELATLAVEVGAHSDPVEAGAVHRALAATTLISPETARAGANLLDRLIEFAGAQGFPLLLASGHALRGTAALMIDPHAFLPTDAAAALSIIDDDRAQAADLPAPVRARQLAQALSDIAILLCALGMFEVADEMFRRGRRKLIGHADQHDTVTYQLNRVEVLVRWGLQAEQHHDPDAARRRFAGAARAATAAENAMAHSFYPGTETTAARTEPIIAVAHALRDPGADHLDLLTEWLDRTLRADDRALLSLARARCLAETGRRDAAAAALRLAALGPAPVESLLRQMVHGELARMTATAVRDEGWRSYASQLEAELRAQHATRLSTLRKAVEHATLERAHTALLRSASLDPLTGLPHRAALETLLSTLVESADSPFAVALIDLDRFKWVNDTHSHLHGDEVLKAVATALRHGLRDSDVLARYGGDEFVAVLSQIDQHDAMSVLNRMRATVCALPEPVGRGVTVSVGVVAPHPGEPAAAVLRRADRAMYVAKRAGGDQVRSA
ncbi:diguanylate cyclase/phosphodiesterase (GGDEF & EAL domains) with PAS/PAC sensor(s) [Alloactinosynnema sp. L-07]|uniref:GGDEF domain-containing protein n=1 Tax=Alloactinosynnema sp. L-07 TaxID=1653480 RepID=UPI00065F0BA6|nr:GGDEF domain-containing protein [Alloactinosynnema sp. L-07]CRK58606.1 diguanylate cyclase/phosphodiesterase (GGDEF & EAL domains) with PAS/PAC sensor(s) [Alloactinosynnema sp. L-07]